MARELTRPGKTLLYLGLAGSAVCVLWLYFGEPGLQTLIGPPPFRGLPAVWSTDLSSPAPAQSTPTSGALGPIVAGELPIEPKPKDVSSGSDAAPTNSSAPEKLQVISLDAVLAEVGLGLVEWERPTRLRIGQSATVMVKVTPSREPARADFSHLWKQMTGSDALPKPKGRHVTVEPVHLDLFMRATLYGDGFKVDPEATQQQVLDTTQPPSWTWQVTALKPGVPELYLRLESLVKVKDDAVPRRSDTLHLPVHVDPSLREFAQTNWQWFAGVVVLPLIGLVGSRFFRRDDREITNLDRRWSTRGGNYR